ncbi:GGDEF domain-containing protein [Actinoalloteichus caeruleus]|uniref:GGDEF domain-containing protein n=1 Tax=Actinoalloteichus cyanogriseus TaxID=2893586 RepID=UPI003AAFE5E4
MIFSAVAIATLAGLGIAARQHIRLRRENHALAEAVEAGRWCSATGLLLKTPWLTQAHKLLPILEDRALVAIVDLDRFKAINDHYGHAAGDEVLRTQAERLRQALGADALTCRRGDHGADEFLALLDRRDFRADRLRDSLASDITLSDGRRVHVSASIGVALASPGTDTTLAQLLHRADTALYAAKSAGRGRLLAWAPGLRSLPGSFPESTSSTSSRSTHSALSAESAPTPRVTDHGPNRPISFCRA